MRVLIIDDVRVFDHLLLGLTAQDEVVYARTSKEAIDILETRQKWDAVMWDHDLGGEYGKFDRYDTVMPVVTWLEENIFFGYKPVIGLCIIHTANPAGRQVLDAVLKRHYDVRHIDADEYLDRII